MPSAGLKTAWNNKILTMKTVSCPAGWSQSFFASRNGKEYANECQTVD